MMITTCLILLLAMSVMLATPDGSLVSPTTSPTSPVTRRTAATAASGRHRSLAMSAPYPWSSSKPARWAFAGRVARVLLASSATAGDPWGDPPQLTVDSQPDGQGTPMQQAPGSVRGHDRPPPPLRR